MHPKKSMHSTFFNSKYRELQKLVLPKIKYVETHGLLKGPSSHIATMSCTQLSFTGGLKSKSSPLDVTKSEVRNPEWTIAEQLAEEKSELENVKLLDHWIYSKGLHKKDETNYRRTLRQSTTKQVAELGSDLFTSELDSYIVNMASQQLKIRKIIETEQFREKSKKSFANVKAHSRTSATFLTFQGNSTQTLPQSSPAALDNELTTELQCLALKKTLLDKKSELRMLMAENDKLLRTIKDSRIKLDLLLSKKKAPRKNSTKEDLITVRSGRIAQSRKGSISLATGNYTQEVHQRYLEEKREKEKAESQIAAINNNIKAMRAQYECNMQIVHKLEKEVAEIKPEIKAISKTQLDYYYGLLYKGKESRSQGLTWIIKTIWYLGGKINTQNLPAILDQDSVKYLLEASKIEIEKERLGKKLKTLTLENHKQLTDLGKTESWLQSKEEQALENQIQKLAQALKDIKKEEVGRLAKIYLHNELHKKPLKNDIFKKMIGEETARKEYNKMLRKKNEILKNWEKYKSFAFVKPPKKKRKKLPLSDTVDGLEEVPLLV